MNKPVNKKNIAPWVIDLIKEGMRMVITEGTAVKEFEGFNFNAAGKTGTAEYCDNVAQSLNLCQPGNWPAHAWFVGYAPLIILRSWWLLLSIMVVKVPRRGSDRTQSVGSLFRAEADRCHIRPPVDVFIPDK